ncbi:MAG: hypothetical protein ACOVNL_08660 [Prochlorococcaceae cyanobacterium]|jgi:hypothetical protein
MRTALAIATLSLASTGCTRTSPALPKNLNDLVVTIQMEQTSRAGFSHDSIRVELANTDGTVIEQDETHIEVNGARMRLKAGEGMYYNRYAYYSIDAKTHKGFRLLPSTNHSFVLVMPNGSHRPLTILKTPFPVSLNQFSFVRIPLSPPAAEFRWSDLAGPMRLSISRTDQIPDATGNLVSVVGNPENEDSLHRTIGPGWFRSRSGKWRLPQRFLISSPKRRLEMLEAWIQAESTAPVAHPFSRKSSATAQRRLELTLEWPWEARNGTAEP